jgi:hypothetical protein
MTKRFLLFALLIFQCINTFPQQDSVVFKSIGSYYVFYADGTYKLFDIPCDICPPYADNNNLISFGTYIPFKKKAYYLYSDSTLSNEVKVVVSERTDNSPNLTVNISMPAQKDSSNMLRPHYFYAVSIDYKKIGRATVVDTMTWLVKDYYQNGSQFILPNDSNLIPLGFTIRIYPKTKVSRRAYAEAHYVIKDNGANVFDFSIPQFVTGYLDYEIMYNYRLDLYGKKIIGDPSSQTVYVREDIYNKRNYSDWYFPVRPSWEYWTFPMLQINHK